MEKLRAIEIVARNIRRIRDAKGLTQKELASKIGEKTQGYISQIEKCNTKISFEKLSQIAKALDVDELELLRIEEATSFLDEHAMIPLLDVKVAGGLEGYLNEKPTQIDEYFPFKRWWLEKKLKADLTNEKRLKRLVLLRVAGDSMEPTIYDGEVVLVDLFGKFVDPSQIINKKVYLVRWGREEDGISVKRLHLDEKEGILIATSDNPLYRPKEILIEQDLAYYVLGKVIWVGKENI